MEYGTGWGRTRHIIVEVQGHRRGVCGAMLDPLASQRDIMAKPLCKSCMRQRHVTPCSRCGGTGQEPSRENA